MFVFVCLELGIIRVPEEGELNLLVSYTSLANPPCGSCPAAPVLTLRTKACFALRSRITTAVQALVVESGAD